MHGCRFSLGVLPVLLLAAFASAEPGRRQKKSTATAAPVKVVYAVADLVVPVDDFPIPTSADFDIDIDQRQPVQVIPPSTSVPAGMSTNKKRTIEDQLIRLIQSTVAPNSWQDAGGPGTIEYEPKKMSLVVTQSVAVQEEIGELLAALRRLQDVEVAVTLHILKYGDESLDELPIGREQLITGKTHLLEAAQVKQVVTVAEKEKRNEIMQSPRITVFNGQLAFINVQDQLMFLDDVQVEKRDGKFVIEPRYKSYLTGMSCTVRPIASADHKTVDLSMKFRLATLDSKRTESTPLVLVQERRPKYSPSGEEVPPPPEQEIPLHCTSKRPNVALLKLDRLLKAIPTGQTALMYIGTATEEFCDEHKVPSLSEIPLLGHFFKNVEEGRYTRHVLLMLTPNIVIQPEEVTIGSLTWTLSRGDRLALTSKQWVPRSDAFRQGVDGEYVVGADGNIDLRKYGRVHMAGLSLQRAKAVIEKHLLKYSLAPEIDIAVGSNNDRRVQVIYDKDGKTQVFDVLWHDQMTVQDVLKKHMPALCINEATLQIVWRHPHCTNGPTHFLTPRHVLRPGEQVHVRVFPPPCPSEPVATDAWDYFFGWFFDWAEPFANMVLNRERSTSAGYVVPSGYAVPGVPAPAAPRLPSPTNP
jgi:Polysaccharide biosynthesis/export protein/Bacterial type II and III secretion system protein